MRTNRLGSVTALCAVLCVYSASVVVESLPSRAGACSCVSIEGSVSERAYVYTHHTYATHIRHVRRTRSHRSNANTNIARNQIQLLSITQGCYAIINVKWKSSSACAARLLQYTHAAPPIARAHMTGHLCTCGRMVQWLAKCVWVCVYGM